MFCGGAPAHFNIKAMYHWFQRNVTIAYLCSFPEACKVRYGWFPNVEKHRGAEITTTDLAWTQLECLLMWLASVTSLSVCIFPEVQKETKRLWLIDVLLEKAIGRALSQLSKQSPKRVPKEQVFKHHMKYLQSHFWFSYVLHFFLDGHKELPPSSLI